MKNLFVCTLALVIWGMVSCRPKSENSQDDKRENVLDFVDPFIGTDFHGHTFPGATTPFGMVQLSPDNPVSGWDWSSGYHWSSDTIAGFSHTHLSGTGVGDLQDISVMPVVDFDSSRNFSPSDYYVSFSHENEDASPGYYTVLLNNGVTVELTATAHCGVHQYAFSPTTDASVMFDLGFWQNRDMPYETLIESTSEKSIQGYRFSSGWAKDQRVYFYAEFSSAFKSVSWFDKNNTLTQSGSVKSENSIRKGVKAVINWGLLKEPLLLKVGISSVSVEGAKNNLMKELGEKTFIQVKEQAAKQWFDVLNKIQIESDNIEMKRTFYTALYHSHIAPNIYSDVDGSYTGIDGKVHTDKKWNNYYTFSLWDTYRASHPLFTILQPEMVDDFLQAFIMQYKESGLLPVWSLWGNETNCMIGYHAIPVIVDAYMKGLVKPEQVDVLYEAMLASANQNIRDTPAFCKHGYIPSDVSRNSVSKTLEYAFDDWCIAQMAKELKKQGDYEVFSKRAEAYRVLFNQESRLMQPKLRNGDWKNFNPFDAGYKNDYTEANAWQYTWYVPQDVDDLIKLMGGKQEFEAMLDSIFILPPEVGENAAKDVSGFIGQYIHGNEPSHHIAYLYNYIGRPDKTQSLVKRIKDEMYNDKPDGLCGNEDCGQMSAWYVFSSIGMYPVNPANGMYNLGAPSFPRLTLNFGRKQFEVVAHDLSNENKYVQKILLNNQLFENAEISHETIMEGGKLEFFMGDQPNTGLFGDK